MVIPGCKHGAEADRAVERRLTNPEPHLGLEPLPAVIDEADQCNGSLTGTGGKLDQIIELRFWRRVENPVAAQGCEPVISPSRQDAICRSTRATYRWDHP